MRQLLEAVQAGEVAPDEAVERLRRLPWADLGFARVDHHRALRQGLAEVVYGPGKAPAHVAAIVGELLAGGDGPVLVTRADDAQADATLGAHPDGVRTGSTTRTARGSLTVRRHPRRIRHPTGRALPRLEVTQA